MAGLPGRQRAAAGRMIAEDEESRVRHDLLVDALESLNEREKHILMERRLTDEPKTLEELSQVYDVSRERIRQIEVRAFEKLQAALLRLAGEQRLLPPPDRSSVRSIAFRLPSVGERVDADRFEERARAPSVRLARPSTARRESRMGLEQKRRIKRHPSDRAGGTRRRGKDQPCRGDAVRSRRDRSIGIDGQRLQHRRFEPGSAAARRLDRTQSLQFRISRRRVRNPRQSRARSALPPTAHARWRSPTSRSSSSIPIRRERRSPPRRCARSTSSASRTSSSSTASTRPTAGSATSCPRSSR